MAEPLVLNLDAPQDGIVPAADANLHEAELRRVVYRIRDRALEAKAARSGRRCAEGGAGADDADDGDRRDRRRQDGCEDDCLPRIDHSRRGILIDAERGVGKTTFLRAICATVNDYKRFEREPDAAGAPKARVSVRVLPLLDPTLIDGDRVFLATVIANLLDVIERARGRRDVCDRDGRAKEQRFQAALADLHAGLAASADEAWRKLTAEGSADARFIDQLLRLARGGISMADRFECFVRAAADLLDVDMFVQPIDDVDVAQAEAWTTLEVVRRYLSGPTLLPVVAANYPKLESAVLQANVSADDKLLSLLRQDTGGACKTTTFARHMGQLDTQTDQYLRKLLQPDDRVGLLPQRERVLREGHVRLGGRDRPVRIQGLQPAPAPDAPSETEPLLDRVERALFFAPKGHPTGAAAALVPENTRALMDALRAMRLIAVAQAAADAGRRDDGEPHDLLVRGLADLALAHSDALRAAGIAPQDLAAVIRTGVEPRLESIVARRWAQLSAISAASDLRPDPATDLVCAALGLRASGSAPATLSVMSRLFRTAGTLDPADILAVAAQGERGFSLSGAATAVDYLRVGGAWQLPVGLRLMWPNEPAARALAQRAYAVRLATASIAEDVEAFPYLWRWKRHGGAGLEADVARHLGDTARNEKLPPGVIRWGLTAVELGRVKQPPANDAYAALCLFGTRLFADDAWIVDPLRGLEALAQVNQGWTLARSPVPNPPENWVPALLRHLCAGRLDREHGRVPETLQVGGSASAIRSAADQSGPVARGPTPSRDFCIRVDAWLRQAATSTLRVNARVLARATGRWIRTLRELTEGAAARLGTVGGFLERAVLSLLYAVAMEELDSAALRRWTVRGRRPSDDYEDAIRPLVRFAHPTRFRGRWPALASQKWLDVLDAEPARRPNQPDGPLVSLAEAVATLSAPDDAESQPAVPLGELMPLTQLLWSCPILRLCVGADWSVVLDEAVLEAGLDAPRDEATALSQPSPHDWLCAIPLIGDLGAVGDEAYAEAEKVLNGALPDLNGKATEPAPPTA